MNIIKLNAIDSTNRFLKDLSATQNLDNFTVVVTENQLEGKGQRGAKWISENGKNLTFSILVHHSEITIKEIYLINIITSITILDVLKTYDLEQLSIKWPNDILSENKKICGILIENTIKSNGSIESIIGIGLNVNQNYFENLPQASSLLALKKKYFDKEEILNAIITALAANFSKSITAVQIWEKYHNLLFKKGIPTVFENNTLEKFMGIIQGVSDTGKLQVLQEDDSIKEYDIKEIKMLYY